MRLLLDTHVLLWWLTQDDELSAELRDLIRDTPDVYISAASAWELAIKQSSGKLAAPDDLMETIGNAGFTQLSMTFTHAVAAGRLDPIHRDPFDRMLIAQAKSDGLTLVTRDLEIRKYDVPILTA